MSALAPARGEVQIVEVGPRDGLQNEPMPVPVDARIALVQDLAEAGLTRIECGAFVRPERVPQMASSDAVCRALTADVMIAARGVRLSALVPNLIGLERARAAGVREVAVFAAASETFSRRNVNQSIDEALRSHAEVCAAAGSAGLAVRGYVSTAFGCPYEGEVAVSAVIRVTDALLRNGVFEVAISDTIGVAHPAQVRQVMREVLRAVPARSVALHFHDTRGTALANVLAALDLEVTVFDASAGGLGGCPFAPGATGNLATEDLLYMLHGLGLARGVDLNAVVAASARVERVLGRHLPSRYYRAVRSATGRTHDGSRPGAS
ncbi:MAG: hydroxymethylglutaryl-CoA lyase [Luteitalea sp.]|nr:hydroxymethylglutaryl-CoA lyase [Acidobacteriota bacterium]